MANRLDPGGGPALLKAAMALRKLTQLDTAAHTGITQPSLSRYLSGKSVPSASHRIVLKRAFGIPFEAWPSVGRNGGAKWSKPASPEKPDSSAGSGTPKT